MAIGHVQLDTLQLKLKGNGLPTQVLANQMAPKIGSGEGEYSNLDTWAAWIQDTWTDGVGNMNPYKNGGVLYSEAETRVPEQIILPQRFLTTDTRTLTNGYLDSRYIPTSVTSYLTVGGNTGSNQRLAIRIRTGSSVPTIVWSHFLIERDPDVSLTVEIQGETSTAPNGTVLDTRTITVDRGAKGFSWEGIGHSGSGTLSTSTNYWLVIKPTTATDTFRIAMSTQTFNTLGKVWNGSAWSNTAAGSYPAYSFGSYTSDTPLNNLFATFNNTLVWISDATIRTYSTANQDWDSTATVTLTTADVIRSAIEWDGYLYMSVLSFDDSSPGWSPTVGKRMSTAGTVTDLAYVVDLFGRSGGHIWRTLDNEVWYSEDASTWNGPHVVCPPDEKILSMAGIGQVMYFFTKWGIYSLQPGDFPVPIMPWGAPSIENGIEVVTHQGAIIVLANGRIYRFSEDGSIQDIWLGQDINNVAGLGLKPMALASTNSFLFCVTASEDNTTYNSRFPAVWCMMDGNWHIVNLLPAASNVANYDDLASGIYGRNPYRCLYHRQTGRLWVGGGTSGYAWGVSVSDYTLNPYFDPTSSYIHNAFVEWDWFYGPIREAEKDWESVTLTGEFAAGQSVEVYWKETTSGDWSLLGTVTADGQELRWDITARPATDKIKLGLLLKTSSASLTPRVRSIRLKYHTMTRDWFRWTLPVDVSGGLGGRPKQELLDGTYRTETAAQLKAALDALATQVEPMIYTDVDGLQYEVKVTDASFNYTMVTYNAQSTVKEWEGVYTLTIEAVTPGTYTAP